MNRNNLILFKLMLEVYGDYTGNVPIVKAPTGEVWRVDLWGHFINEPVRLISNETMSKLNMLFTRYLSTDPVAAEKYIADQPVIARVADGPVPVSSVVFNRNIKPTAVVAMLFNNERFRDEVVEIAKLRPRPLFHSHVSYYADSEYFKLILNDSFFTLLKYPRGGDLVPTSSLHSLGYSHIYKTGYAIKERSFAAPYLASRLYPLLSGVIDKHKLKFYQSVSSLGNYLHSLLRSTSPYPIATENAVIYRSFSVYDGKVLLGILNNSWMYLKAILKDEFLDALEPLVGEVGAGVIESVEKDLFGSKVWAGCLGEVMEQVPKGFIVTGISQKYRC